MSEHDADKSEIRKDVADVYAFLKVRDEDPVRNRHTDAGEHGPLDLSQFFFGGSDLRNVVELPNAVQKHLAPEARPADPAQTLFARIFNAQYRYQHHDAPERYLLH